MREEPKSNMLIWLAAGGCGLVALFGCVICGGVGGWLYFKSAASSRPPLEGAWEYSGAAIPPNLRSVRLMAGKQLVNTVYDRNSRTMVLFTGGTFTLQGESYKEQIEYVSPGIQEVLLGKEQSFTAKIQSDRFSVSGVLTNGNPINESWTRFGGPLAAKPEPHEGAWEAVGPKPAPDSRAIKVMVGNQFTIVAFNPTTKTVTALVGGSFTTKKEEFMESVEYTSRGIGEAMLEKQQTMSMRIDGDQLSVTRTLPNGAKLDETWRRIK